MIVVGGTYLEECDWPEWKRIMGPGVRAALAVSEVSPGSELYTYVHEGARPDLDSTMLANGLKAQVRIRSEPISFYYKHPLSSPPKQEPNDLSFVESEPWNIEGETVLVFRLLESKVLVNADRAVFELSQRDEEVRRGDIKKLALIAAENDFLDAFESKAGIRDFAAQTMAAHNADLMIVRTQSGGGVLFDGEVEHSIPAYAASEWFKIGAGNVFCAMFAHYWGEKKMDPLQAADLASRSSANYASTRALPVVAEDKLPDMDTFDPSSKCKIFVASPCNSMAQQWLLDEALRSFDNLGVETVSPYELGLDGALVENTDIETVLRGCNAVLALAEGADIPSVLAVGLARVRELPIVVLAEESKERRLDLWQGTDCEIARDFASAVYRALVAAKRRARA